LLLAIAIGRIEKAALPTWASKSPDANNQLFGLICGADKLFGPQDCQLWLPDQFPLMMTEPGSTNSELTPFPLSKVTLRICTPCTTTIMSTINLSEQLCSLMTYAHRRSRYKHGHGHGSGLLPTTMMCVCVSPLFNPIRGHQAWTITMPTTIYSVLKGGGLVEPGTCYMDKLSILE